MTESLPRLPSEFPLCLPVDVKMLRALILLARYPQGETIPLLPGLDVVRLTSMNAEEHETWRVRVGGEVRTYQGSLADVLGEAAEHLRHPVPVIAGGGGVHMASGGFGGNAFGVGFGDAVQESDGSLTLSGIGTGDEDMERALGMHPAPSEVGALPVSRHPKPAPGVTLLPREGEDPSIPPTPVPRTYHAPLPVDGVPKPDWRDEADRKKVCPEPVWDTYPLPGLAREEHELLTRFSLTRHPCACAVANVLDQLTHAWRTIDEMAPAVVQGAEAQTRIERLRSALETLATALSQETTENLLLREARRSLGQDVARLQRRAEELTAQLDKQSPHRRYTQND